MLLKKRTHLSRCVRFAFVAAFRLHGHFDVFADGSEGHDAHDVDFAVEGVVWDEVDVAFVGFFEVFEDLAAVGAWVLEDGEGVVAVEAAFGGEVGEQVEVGDVLAFFKVGFEDAGVEGDVFALFLGPEGEAVGVFGGDVRNVGHVVVEADFGGHVLNGFELFEHFVLLGCWQVQPFDKGAFRVAFFAGVEQVDAVGDFVVGDAHFFEHLEELLFADVAVWAGVVGPDFDV